MKTGIVLMQKGEAMTNSEAIDILKERIELSNEMLAKPFFQDAQETIKKTIETYKVAIKALEYDWIPVTERLPEERDWYLGIFKEPDTGWINPLPFICDYLLGKKTKATTKEGWILRDCTDREEHIDYYFNLECVAWMPLPTPWKGEENE